MIMHPRTHTGMVLQVIVPDTATILEPLTLFDCPVIAQGRSIVGTWTWAFAPSGEPRENGTVTFKPDGTMTWSGGSQGTWERSGRTVTLRWLDKDSVDTMMASGDERTLEGTNKDGWRVRGTRQIPRADSVVGTW